MKFRIQRGFRSSESAAPASSRDAGPISGRPKSGVLSRGGRVALALFFGVFLAVGVGGTYAFAIRPWLKVSAARNWTPVTAVVRSSEVRSHHGDSTTYSVAITYAYQAGGREYLGNRYDFSTGASSGRAAKAEIVARHPAGRLVTCYVNPADPSEAVLERERVRDWGYGLIPLVFVLVGAGGVWFALTGSRAKSEGAAGRGRPAPATFSRAGAGVSPDFNDSGEDAVAGELKPAVSRKAKLIGAIAIALFWNGIVSVFVVNIVGEALRGGVVMWFFALFLLPFVAIGLFLIGVMIRQFLALGNPVPYVTLARRAVAPGETLQVGWRFAGGTHRLKRTQVLLEGTEEATYRRGTDTRTDREVFRTFTLADKAGLEAGQAGRAELPLPADLMHSFDSGNNRVRWTLRIQSEIPGWPDVDEPFEIKIRPTPPPARTHA